MVGCSSNVAAISLNDLATGERGAPSIIDFPLFTDWLEDGFTYETLISVLVNGADYTATTGVDATDPQAPIFTVPSGIDPDYSLILKFTARVGSSVTPGTNPFKVAHFMRSLYVET